MKTMKIKEIRQMNDAELTKQLAAFREKTRELRFKASAQELKSPREITAVRKNIAKILTILKERAT